MKAGRGIHLEDIIEGFRVYQPDGDTEKILSAYAFASKAHGGQMRRSGLPYMSHPMEVALILVRLKMEPDAIATALLHDTVEDTDATVEEIRELFGENVGIMVEGLTKLATIKFRTQEERQAENVRKMIFALADDIRIILVKLADRLHNMRTMEFLSPDRQMAIGRETLEIYSPMANRLGIGWMQSELEDLSFKYVYPHEYAQIESTLRGQKQENEKFIITACNQVKEELLKERIPAEVSGRTKTLYSIYTKMQNQELELDEIYDIAGIRIVASSQLDCYKAVGLVHAKWKPIPGKFKDYIAVPKENMYQSIHSTVLAPDGRRVEFQFRTQQMHHVSENGIAAHWQYKSSGEGAKNTNGNDNLLWVRRLLDLGNRLDDSEEFLENVKLDLFPDEVYVFTPTQEVKSFPRGATPLDYAYSVHSEIGNSFASALVNNRPVAIDYHLNNGDRVEIITLEKNEPKMEWLQKVKTSRAKSLILSYIRGKEKSDAVRLGQEIIEAELKKFDLPPERYFTQNGLDTATKELGIKNRELLLQKVSVSKISAYSVLQKLLPKKERQSVENARKRSITGLLKRLTWKKSGSNRGVRVGNINNLLIRFARCCNPLPGDKIAGYLSGEQGMVIHTKSCPLLLKLMPDREKLVEAEWDEKAHKELHEVKIEVISADKQGMLGILSTIIAECDANIASATVNKTDPKRGKMEFIIEIEDLFHLQKIISALKQVKGVKAVHRVMEEERG